MAAWEARGKDPHLCYEIRTRTCERDLEEIVQRDTAEHGDQHQPGHRRFAIQKQEFHDREGYDRQHSDAAETGYVAYRLL